MTAPPTRLAATGKRRRRTAARGRSALEAYRRIHPRNGSQSHRRGRERHGPPAHFDTFSRIPPEKYPFGAQHLPSARYPRAGQAAPYRPIFTRGLTRAASAIPTACTTRRMPAPSCATLPLMCPRRWMWSACAKACNACLARMISRPSRRRRNGQNHRPHPERGKPCPKRLHAYPHRARQCVFVQYGAHHRGYHAGYRHGPWLDASAFQRALDTGDRLALGVTAPACGLELTQVEYDGE